ncbi:MAG: VapE family protein [Ghiorsea sp.]
MDTFYKNLSGFTDALFPVAGVVPRENAEGIVYYACGCGQRECPNVGKHPLFRGWHDSVHTTREIEAIYSDLTNKTPTPTNNCRNLGLKTGQTGLGYGLLVVDLDVGENKDGLASWATLCDGRTVDTFSVRTGSGGMHLYFKTPVDSVLGNTVSSLGLGIDTRGRNGYVLAPPSLHACGDVYSVIHDVPVAPIPAWLLHLLSVNERPANLAGTSLDDLSEEDRVTVYAAAFDYMDYLEPCVAGEGGNERLYLVFRQLALYGITGDDAIGVVDGFVDTESPFVGQERSLPTFNSRCEPPWGIRELSSLAQRFANGEGHDAIGCEITDVLADYDAPSTRPAMLGEKADYLDAKGAGFKFVARKGFWSFRGEQRFSEKAATEPAASLIQEQTSIDVSTDAPSVSEPHQQTDKPSTGTNTPLASQSPQVFLDLSIPARMEWFNKRAFDLSKTSLCLPDSLEYDNKGNLLKSRMNLRMLMYLSTHLIDSAGVPKFRRNVRTGLCDIEPSLGYEGIEESVGLNVMHVLAKESGSAAEFNPTWVMNELITMADAFPHDPILLMFEDFPSWDGVKRADALFVKYLQADDNPYTREATMMFLRNIIRRVYNPGCVCDTMPILVGAQGIGKGQVMKSLVGQADYMHSPLVFDGSVDLRSDRDAAMKMRERILVDFQEMDSMKRHDAEAIKAFLTITHDRYRKPYAREVSVTPRGFAFFASTNDFEGNINDSTGVRRFHRMVCRKTAKLSSAEVKNVLADRSQIWAEVKAQGDAVFLPRGETYSSLKFSTPAEPFHRVAAEEAVAEGDLDHYISNFVSLAADRPWSERSGGANMDDVLRHGCSEYKNIVAVQEVKSFLVRNAEVDSRLVTLRNIRNALLRLGWVRPDAIDLAKRPVAACGVARQRFWFRSRHCIEKFSKEGNSAL